MVQHSAGKDGDATCALPVWLTACVGCCACMKTWSSGRVKISNHKHRDIDRVLQKPDTSCYPCASTSAAVALVVAVLVVQPSGVAVVVAVGVVVVVVCPCGEVPQSLCMGFVCWIPTADFPMHRPTGWDRQRPSGSRRCTTCEVPA